MGNINPNFNDRVKYELYNAIEGSLLVIEPEGWQTDEKEISRHKEYHGIFPKFSNSLKFMSSGADLINFIKQTQGVNADIRLTKSERHPHTDVWTVSYYGFLDLSTWEEEDSKVSVKFNSGGLEQSLKARESEQVEIDRLTTIDGLPLDVLPVKKLRLEGRNIFLKSTWESNISDNISHLRLQSSDGNTHSRTMGIPLKLVNRSHEEAHSILSESSGSESIGSTGIMFFAVADRVRNLKLSATDISFKPAFFGPFEWAFFKVCLATYKDGTAYTLKTRKDIFHYGEGSPHSLWNINNQTCHISVDESFTLLAGESASLEFYLRADLLGRSEFRAYVTEVTGKMQLTENSFFDPTDCKFVLAHDLAERLVAINTNQKNALYSEFLGRSEIGYASDGPGAFIGNTHGFWVRQFDKLPLPSEGPPLVENKFKPLTTSFKDFMSSYTAVWNLGLGIENNYKRERIRIEPLSFFYNFNVTIKLPNQVSSEKRSCAADYYYSSIEIGYEDGGSYEEAMGLDEYNAKSNFTTIINRVKNTYTQLSKYRADSYGKEFARRKPSPAFDTEDTSYDSSVFLMDLKKDSLGIYKERLWQDDFAQAPTGTFSPETATNLRLSPFNMMLRHGWVIASSLLDYPADYVRYGSSTANSSLKTKLAGGFEYAENGNIVNSELQRARFKPEWVEFEHLCDFGIMQQVEGNTVINGKSIPNFYGLVEFTNSKGKKEKGFLFNLKPNGKGNWKILTANR